MENGTLVYANGTLTAHTIQNYGCQLGYTTNMFKVQNNKSFTDKNVSIINKAFSSIDNEGLYLHLVIPGTEKESIKVVRIATNIEISYHCGMNDSDETFAFDLGNFYLPNFDFDELLPIYENGILSIFIGYQEGVVEEYEVH